MSWLLDTNVLIGSMQIGSSRHQPSTEAIAAFPQNLIEFWASAGGDRGCGWRITAARFHD